MCIEEQKLVDKFTEENRVSDIKFMFSEGILWKELQKELNFHQRKSKRFLRRNSKYGELQEFVRTSLFWYNYEPLNDWFLN